MSFDDRFRTDPWEARGSGAEEAPPDWADESAYFERGPVIEGPDALDLVLEADTMVAVFASQRYVRIDQLRRDAIVAAKRPGGPGTEMVLRSLRLELAAAMRITESAAAGLLARAEGLVHRYPDVLDSLSHANITERHAELLIDGLDVVESQLVAEVVPRALALAEELPVGSFRRALRRLLDGVRAESLTERHEAASERRRVVVEPTGDGMGWLSVLMPLVEAHAGYGRLTAMAKVLAGREDETRTLDQLRADILGDLLIEGDAAAVPPEARGIRATVAVTVPVLALLSGGVEEAVGPVIVEGVGPITTSRARELCGGADGWMRILTHPETGVVLSVGREQYRPPPALRKLARWRADRCMAPGCGVPASRCELDHTVAWEHGGETSLENLAPLCKGHHTVKHHGGWKVRQIEGSGGVLEWTSPAGRVYLVEPERRVPVFRPDPVPDPTPAPF